MIKIYWEGKRGRGEATMRGGWFREIPVFHFRPNGNDEVYTAWRTPTGLKSLPIPRDLARPLSIKPEIDYVRANRIFIRARDHSPPPFRSIYIYHPHPPPIADINLIETDNVLNNLVDSFKRISFPSRWSEIRR